MQVHTGSFGCSLEGAPVVGSKNGGGRDTTKQPPVQDLLLRENVSMRRQRLVMIWSSEACATLSDKPSKCFELRDQALKFTPLGQHFFVFLSHFITILLSAKCFPFHGHHLTKFYCYSSLKLLIASHSINTMLLSVSKCWRCYAANNIYGCRSSEKNSGSSNTSSSCLLTSFLEDNSIALLGRIQRLLACDIDHHSQLRFSLAQRRRSGQPKGSSFISGQGRTSDLFPQSSEKRIANTTETVSYRLLLLFIVLNLINPTLALPQLQSDPLGSGTRNDRISVGADVMESSGSAAAQEFNICDEANCQENYHCVPLRSGYKCQCNDGFIEQDGQCELALEKSCSKEDDETFCLHGGICIMTLTIGTHYARSCRCDPESGYTGTKCEQINSYRLSSAMQKFDSKDVQNTTAVVLVIFLATLVVLSVVGRLRCYLKDKALEIEMLAALHKEYDDMTQQLNESGRFGGSGYQMHMHSLPVTMAPPHPACGDAAALADDNYSISSSYYFRNNHPQTSPKMLHHHCSALPSSPSPQPPVETRVIPIRHALSELRLQETQT